LLYDFVLLPGITVEGGTTVFFAAFLLFFSLSLGLLSPISQTSRLYKYYYLLLKNTLYNPKNIISFF
jgi:hypothetical protein